MFEALSLPAYNLRISKDSEGIIYFFDILRNKNVVATPEEWVRQHFVNFLISHLQYPKSFIVNEKGLNLNGTKRRCDTLIYSRDLRPLCIIEYKRPSVEITRNVFDQIARYNSVLNAPFLIVSNGIKHYCCRYTGEGYNFMKSIPLYEEMLQYLNEVNYNCN